MKTKKHFIIIISFWLSYTIYSQIGIGTSDPKAILDVQSTNSGILLPRISNTSNITSPQEGMIYYDSTNKLFSFYDGTQWQYLNFSSQIEQHDRNSGQVKINGYDNGSGTTKITFTNIGGNPDSNGDFTLIPIVLDTDESLDEITPGELVISGSPTTTWPKNLDSSLTNNQLQETIYDFDNDTFLENPVPGQVTIWRIILSFTKSSAATGIIFRLYNPSPDSSFDERKLIHISPEHIKGNLVFNIITIGDQLSIPSPIGNNNAKGYRFEIGADDMMDSITLESITRISMQYQ
ncbi:hypothetical protein UJ101_01501 [Flavobacteriaceae bacterium UJ101]|nr:hypothetical protein UJ101_01501 [Flavobacteriaceae bacterium UJ101]